MCNKLSSFSLLLCWLHVSLPKWGLTPRHNSSSRNFHQGAVFARASKIDHYLEKLFKYLTYHTNPKDLQKYLIPGTRCCCLQKKKNTKAKNKLFFGVMPYARMGSAKKNRKMKYFLPLPPFLQECQNRRRVCPTACCPPLPCRMPHSAPCFLFENDESGTRYQGIRDCHNIRYFNPDADVPQSI